MSFAKIDNHWLVVSVDALTRELSFEDVALASHPKPLDRHFREGNAIDNSVVRW